MLCLPTQTIGSGDRPEVFHSCCRRVRRAEFAISKPRCEWAEPVPAQASDHSSASVLEPSHGTPSLPCWSRRHSPTDHPGGSQGSLYSQSVSSAPLTHRFPRGTQLRGPCRVSPPFPVSFLSPQPQMFVTLRCPAGTEYPSQFLFIEERAFQPDHSTETCANRG